MYMADSGHGMAGIIFLRFIWWRGLSQNLNTYCIFLKRGFWSKTKIPYFIYNINTREMIHNYCVFIPSPIRVGTLLMEVPGTPIGASFFEFELKPTGKDSADQTQHEFQHHIV